MKHLLWLLVAFVGAIVATFTVCWLIEILNLRGLLWLCGHNGYIQIFVYFVLVFGWLEIRMLSSRRDRDGESTKRS